MAKSMAHSMSKLFLIPIIGLSLSANSNAEQNYNINTNVIYPNINKGTIFNLTNSSDHKILFYTGEKNGESVTGYFRASHFLGWTENKFAPFEYYKEHPKKTFLDVTSGPEHNTITLSYIEGIGQLLSWSADGKSWVSQKINIANTFFNKLESTYVYNIKGVAAYGTNHTSVLTSVSNKLWQVWALPNACYTEKTCTIENKYFGSQFNQFLLLQTRSLSGLQTNKLYTSTNLTTWYHNQLPFADDTVNKVFNDQNHSAIFASVLDKNNNHKLWVSEDLTNWATFDLPADTTLTDVKVYKNHKIALLLKSKVVIEKAPTELCEDKFKTDLVILDSESKELKVVNTFEGEVSSLNMNDDKLYLIGNFVNQESKDHVALASMNI